MLFSTLATYFERLEQTSSRLSMIDILADLFRNTKSEEIDKVMYLLQGRVAPFFEPIEIGIADKTAASALAGEFNIDRELVLKEYSKKGDLGLVAQELRSKIKSQISKITVEEVFNTLLSIANTSGEGTVEKRIKLYQSVLEKLDSTSIKHFVRIVLGKTRLGIGDPTILDSLALAILGDRTKRKLLEKAYNETSDLGLIGKTLFEKGLKGVEKLTVSVGRPIRSELCERLPNPVKVFEKMAMKSQRVRAAKSQSL